MFTCKEILEALTEYLEGDMSAEDSKTFEEHMEACAPCHRFLLTYEKSSQLARQTLGKEDVPAEVQDRVRNFLKARLGLT